MLTTPGTSHWAGTPACTAAVLGAGTQVNREFSGTRWRTYKHSRQRWTLLISSSLCRNPNSARQNPSKLGKSLKLDAGEDGPKGVVKNSGKAHAPWNQV